MCISVGVRRLERFSERFPILSYWMVSSLQRSRQRNLFPCPHPDAISCWLARRNGKIWNQMQPLSHLTCCVEIKAIFLQTFVITHLALFLSQTWIDNVYIYGYYCVSENCFASAVLITVVIESKPFSNSHIWVTTLRIHSCSLFWSCPHLSDSRMPANSIPRYDKEYCDGVVECR